MPLPLPGSRRKGKLVSKAPKVLKELFASLNSEDQTLRDFIIGYIANGTAPSDLALITTVQADKLYHALVYGGSDDSEARPLWRPIRLEPVQWMRLGQVAVIAGVVLRNDVGWPPSIPEWFWTLQYLRSDWRWSEGQAWSMDHWDPGHLTKVLEAGGADPVLAPRIIAVSFVKSHAGEMTFWTAPTAPWEMLRRRPCVEAMFKLLRANAERLPEWLGDLKANDHGNAIRWLACFPDVLFCLQGHIPKWTVAPNKAVREAAIATIGRLPADQAIEVAVQGLRQGTPDRIRELVAYLGRQDSAVRTALAHALADPPVEQLSAAEVTKWVEIVSSAAQTVRVVEDLQEVELTIPPAPPLDLTPLGADAADRLSAAVTAYAARLQAAAETADPPWYARHEAAEAAKVTRQDLVALCEWLNGASSYRPKLPAGVARAIAPVLAAWPLAVQAKFATESTVLGTDAAPHLLMRGEASRCDLRTLEAAWRRAGVADAVEDVISLALGPGGISSRSAENTWPLFAEHSELVGRILAGAANRPDPQVLADLFQIVNLFPALPPELVPVVARLATRKAKTGRAEAQALLAKHPGCLSLALDVMGASDGATRAAAAAWVGKIGDPAAAEPLRKKLANERSELVQAAIISALIVLGEDVTELLTPEALATAAKKALTKKPPTSISWLNLETLPACRWASGEPVEPAVIKWFVVLATRLKDPAGLGLIPIYVSLLDKPSQHALGRFALDSWIAWDTRKPPDSECREYAQSQVDSLYDEYQRKYREYPEYPDYQAKGALTRDQVFDELYRECHAAYVGSAIDSKGLLALASGAEGTYVLETCQRYIRQHTGRRAQVEALVIAAAANPEPGALQFVLQIARRHRQATVRDKAAQLVEALAEQRGWTTDELADRTIPTAGFDEAGLLELDYGSRVFTGRISRMAQTGVFGIELRGPSGNLVKALPKAAKADDAEAAKEAKAQFTRSKKELAAIVRVQSERLYDAMCSQRGWEAHAWREVFLDHPLMRHLGASLVWVAQGAADYGDAGSGIGRRVMFRPTAEGELLNANDDACDLDPNAQVRLAHAVTCGAEEAQRWRAHLADYGVAMLFDQFNSKPPEFAEGAMEIADHCGWASDTFTIKNRATKRGYGRGAMIDGPFYMDWVKEFPSLGVRAWIGFTGALIPEELRPAAVTTLAFGTMDYLPLPLAQVPPVLLAEAYGDYLHLAEPGRFDPEWESLTSC
ncbi:MAG: DUF4132 domain-containing protein [Bifidobacteriaceae bacterium]|jgi:hypothetical protein|nr:DUF4132 domain-containing protein [Bifidobacteriaceae bacterium]